MTERIQGKVAKVTSDRELIINRGREHGVTKGTYFYIKDEPLEITDPDSGKPIGTVSPIKVVVQAEEIADKFCIARTFRTSRVKISDEIKGGSLYGAISTGRLDNWLQPPKPAQFETKIETLRYDPKKGKQISSGESVVKIGDLAESVSTGEDINPVTTTLFH